MTFEEVIQIQGKLIYKNVGISMLPWIHEGKDLMVIERVPEQLKKYDAVLFIRPHVTGRGRYVLHRIIRCYEDGSFYIMGDNTLSGEKVRRENIIGLLTKIQQPGRLIDVNDFSYRCKVRLWWWFCLPLKNWMRKGKRRLSVILRKILKVPEGQRLREYLKRKA